VSLPGCSEHTPDNYEGIAFLFLDQALGEYEVEMKVGYIGLKARDEALLRALSLAQMPAAFERLLKPGPVCISPYSFSSSGCTLRLVSSFGAAYAARISGSPLQVLNGRFLLWFVRRVE
jgi:hypothetical protein